MLRLGISVEGASEREFVRLVLQAHLAAFGILATPVDLHGHVSADRLRSVLPRLLGDFEVVTTLYDFYGFQRRATSQVDELEALIAGLVREPLRQRLIPYVQQHEFEALLFAVPEHTVAVMGAAPSLVAELQTVVRASGGPELINDGPQTSPSHRLQRLMPRYRKTFHGPQALASAGLPAIRAQCPRFHAWVARLESLGGASK